MLRKEVQQIHEAQSPKDISSKATQVRNEGLGAIRAGRINQQLFKQIVAPQGIVCYCTGGVATSFMLARTGSEAIVGTEGGYC